MNMKQAVEEALAKGREEYASHNSTFEIEDWLILNKSAIADEARNIFLLQNPDDSFFKCRHHTEKTLKRLKQLRQNAMKYL